MRLQKIFIFLLILFGFFVLTGCNNDTKPIEFEQSSEFQTLKTVNYPSLKYESKNLSAKAIAALKDFTYQTMIELFKEEENYVYSPLSIYMALSMPLEGVSSDAARLEIENLLGLEKVASQEAMKTVYQNNYYKNDDGTVRLANSFWFKNGFPVETDFLNSLSENYYAESYQTSFNSEAHQNIIDWINHYTEDFLSLTKEKFPIPSDAIILLLNTIYFDNKWKVSFDEKATKEGLFYTPEGTVKADFMNHKVKTSYLETDTYITAQDYFENNNSIVYLLPKAGNNVLDLLDYDILSEVIDYENKHLADIYFSVPKFHYFSNFALNQPLMNLGVKEIFSSTNALDLISPSAGLFISEVKQSAGIEFSEAGVKAAAVTGVVGTTSLPPQIVLNRPFIYIIKDSNGIPLFVGILQNPKA
ncbi:MAG: serpin family protein [Bacilli bacterium]|nr:serpin family protein [Bacilli bacterium]